MSKRASATGPSSGTAATHSHAPASEPRRRPTSASTSRTARSHSTICPTNPSTYGAPRSSAGATTTAAAPAGYSHGPSRSGTPSVPPAKAAPQEAKTLISSGSSW